MDIESLDELVKGNSVLIQEKLLPELLNGKTSQEEGSLDLEISQDFLEFIINVVFDDFACLCNVSDRLLLSTPIIQNVLS